MKLVAVHAPCRLLYSNAHFNLITSQAKIHDPILSFPYVDAYKNTTLAMPISFELRVVIWYSQTADTVTSSVVRWPWGNPEIAQFEQRTFRAISFWRISFGNVFRVYILGSFPDWVLEISEIASKQDLGSPMQSPNVILNDISIFSNLDYLCILFLCQNLYKFLPFSILNLNCPTR